ncbi:phosphodiester glycosidase family protein [Sphingobacterium olei]|uniref:Phosphodiester glycosidase family protein n=1 Tax=Sphingobacterium olei TaxID=2571155 RepID=A0A4U0P3I5_9SPHI|nr:phosphodiester glycosidase family protein [Sphingobacterium olei]TJZ61926.1 phosphodiester glycosidase family protein [Sphingobacterium olei]
MKSIYSFLLHILLLLSVSCQSDITKEIPALVDQNPLKEDQSVKFPNHWIKQSGIDELNGVDLYKSNTTVGVKKTNMYVMVIDPAKVEMKPILSSAIYGKRVSAYYNDEPGTVYAAVNGGYFWDGTSLSVVRYNAEILSDNIRAIYQTYNGQNTAYYPTRAAFGIDINNKPTVGWVYSIQNKGPLYIYPQPSSNAAGTIPQPMPTASFPTGGTLWDAHSAIGGSPMLVKDGAIRLTDKEEMISVDNTSSRPRTAIGYLENGLVLVFVAEGGNTTESVPGLTLLEVANQMMDLGCKGAINLDGGGSSTLYVNNKHTIKPSDPSGERTVKSALVFKKK